MCDTLQGNKVENFSTSENETNRKQIQFSINGDIHNVGNIHPIDMNLNEYIRDVANLKGTKVMCKEGGCGSCVVNGKVFDYTTQKYKNVSINSCLFPLYSCDKWEFTTVEGIGSKAKGFHPIQQRLADNNGSQCGFCSPGMVMNMYSLLLNNPKPTKSLIENSFDGNICRCTGYRPILDAMKSFSSDDKPIDIEDLNQLKCLSIQCNHQDANKKIHIIQDQNEWFAPQNLDQLYSLLDEYKLQNYTLINGNTSKGVYKNDGPFDVYINLQHIPDLYSVQQTSSSLTIGSNITLNKLADILNTNSALSGFEYLSTIAHHVNKIANVPVRNIASWSGNLVMKLNHLDFPSDVFICFETIGALLTINNSDKSTFQVSPADFLKINLKGKFISSISIPKYDKTKTFIKTYKIMPRSQNAHAYVNAGFRFTLDPETYKVIENPTIVFGGINSSFIHAIETERFLNGKVLSDQSTITNAFKILESEINPSNDPVLASPEYRRSLAISLLYKFILTVCDKFVDDKYKSATTSIIDSRQLSSGQQSYPETPNMYPVTKPMTKLNAYSQTSGEAPYVYDMVELPNQLHGAFVVTQVANCRINTIDTSIAMNMPGVVKIIFAKDVPGVNNFNPIPSLPEQLFCDDIVSYAGQSVGLVIAETFSQALEASKAVKITYKDVKKPILTIAEAIQAQSFHPKPCDDFIFGDAEKAVAEAPYSIQGNCFMDSQYHFYMEGQVAICQPNEDGFEIHSSTQWLDYVQKSASQVLGIKNSSINVKVKQLGGSYGGKITRANITASAAAVAASVLNKPVKVVLDLNTCMELVGKRFPWYADYSVGVDETGKLLGIVVKYYADAGCNPNDNALPTIYDFGDNAYSCLNWHMIPNVVKTHLPANTACRSPGTFPSISIMEYIIEHVAKFLNLDPVQVRTINLYKKGQVTPHGQPLPYFNVDVIMNSLITTSEYMNRISDINNYNNSNRWKKRGISLVPIKWGAVWNGGYYNSFVTIYNGDGSIAISHGGVETGQGINTKVAQVCAYELGVPMEIISIKYGDNLTNANSMTTGGSVTTEIVCQAIIECCKALNASLDPVRKLMPPNYTWLDLIDKAFSMGIDLTARYWIYPNASTPLEYLVYGAAVTESIVDVLTGETQILRTDMLYDCGSTINGEIDVGQAEGAFVMGLGFWLTEKIKYDPKTGRCLTNGTWEYKPPTTKDIPIDFRVNFLNNNPNPLGVLGSKCVGEPPLCLTPSIIFSVKNAIDAARKEVNQDRFFVLNSPATVDIVQRSCLIDCTQLKFKD